jgi:hypothetical protein
MTDQHPVTPPPELATHWLELWNNMPVPRPVTIQWIATQAAQWGADQELEACCKWTDVNGWDDACDELRAARRSKPPTLKEQALTALSHLLSGSAQTLDTTEAEFYIRRALEALPND